VHTVESVVSGAARELEHGLELTLLSSSFRSSRSYPPTCPISTRPPMSMPPRRSEKISLVGVAITPRSSFS
jgi:hypothetical protein